MELDSKDWNQKSLSRHWHWVFQKRVSCLRAGIGREPLILSATNDRKTSTDYNPFRTSSLRARSVFLFLLSSRRTTALEYAHGSMRPSKPQSLWRPNSCPARSSPLDSMHQPPQSSALSFRLVPNCFYLH